jgi:hypothetical protein
MIPRKEAEKLIERFSGLPGYPKDKSEGVEAMVDAMQTAQNIGVAKVFTTSWIFDETTAPTPAHIYRYFHPRKTGEQTTSAPLPSSKNCPFCNGTGWQIVDGPNKTTAAKPCRCRQVALAAVSDEE